MKKLKLIFNKDKKEYKFNIDDVRKLAKVKFKKLRLKLIKNKYGEDIRKEFYQSICLLEAMNEICSKNGWYTSEDWEKNNVPINKLFRQMVKDSIRYADVRKYYEKQFFDERTRANMGR